MTWVGKFWHFLLRQFPSKDLALKYYVARIVACILPRFKREADVWESPYLFLKQGYQPPRLEKVPSTPARNTALYLLHNSLPYRSGGYAVRSHGLLNSINEICSVVGVTRPGFPEDIPPNKRSSSDEIDRVRYYRLESRLPYRSLGKNYLNAYIQSLNLLAQELRPNLIHAASFSLNGIAAGHVAKNLKIPSIYEVRGLWDLKSVSYDPKSEKSQTYKAHVAAELEACRLATRVFTITHALKSELVSRGISAEKVFVIPNGVDSQIFSPRARSTAVLKKWGLEGFLVVGYVGSIANYEGLDDLIRAIHFLRLRRSDLKVKVLVVGDRGAFVSEDQSIIQQLIADYKLEEDFVFTGRVPHKEVNDYYSVIDICVFPRKALPICEKVSPLKIFEAMSLEKACIVSSVAALTEIVEDKKTGLVFEKSSPDSLSQHLEEALVNSNLRHQLGLAARKWICENRDWRILAKLVESHYSELLS